MPMNGALKDKLCSWAFFVSFKIKSFMVKRLLFIFTLLLSTVAMCAAEVKGVESSSPDFLTGFMSFGGLVSVIVPAIVGFIASKLQNPMNKWVTMWVTAVVGFVVTFFSWWMNLGFPPTDVNVWVVVVDALFVALASTGIVSVVTSEWLAKLFGSKAKGNGSGCD